MGTSSVIILIFTDGKVGSVRVSSFSMVTLTIQWQNCLWHSKCCCLQGLGPMITLYHLLFETGSVSLGIIPSCILLSMKAKFRLSQEINKIAMWLRKAHIYYTTGHTFTMQLAEVPAQFFGGQQVSQPCMVCEQHALKITLLKFKESKLHDLFLIKRIH